MQTSKEWLNTVFGSYFVHVATPYAMAKLGNHFRTQIVEPLLNSGIPECQSLTISTYGTINSGKTILLNGIAGYSPDPSSGNYFPNRLCVYQTSAEHSAGDAIFLHRSHDFGSVAYKTPDKKQRCEKYAQFPLRSTLKIPGVDLYEHTPMSLSGEPGAILIVANLEESSFRLGYYGNRVIKELLNDTPHPLPEQTQLHEFIAIQFCKAAEAVLKQRDSDNAGRLVTILPMHRSPVTQTLFRRFKTFMSDPQAQRSPILPRQAAVSSSFRPCDAQTKAATFRLS